MKFNIYCALSCLVVLSVLEIKTRSLVRSAFWLQARPHLLTISKYENKCVILIIITHWPPKAQEAREKKQKTFIVCVCVCFQLLVHTHRRVPSSCPWPPASCNLRLANCSGNLENKKKKYTRIVIDWLAASISIESVSARARA